MYKGYAWQVIVGTRFDDWIYWTSLLQLHLIITVHTLNSFLIVNLCLYFYWSSYWSLVSGLLLLSMTDSFLSLSRMLWPTVRRPVYLVIKHPCGGLWKIFISQTVVVLLMWGALSDKKTGLSFTNGVGSRQRSHFQIPLPLAWWPYITVSDSRLPFPSPPTTHGATVEVFDPNSTRSCRAEQSRAVAYCRQPASMITPGIEPRWDPWPYICSVSRLLFFSSFIGSPLIKREGLNTFLRVSCVLSRPSADCRQNTMCYSSSVIMRIHCNGNSLLWEQCLPSRCPATDVYSLTA
jgi:hypothetical protein